MARRGLVSFSVHTTQPWRLDGQVVDAHHTSAQYGTDWRKLDTGGVSLDGVSVPNRGGMCAPNGASWRQGDTEPFAIDGGERTSPRELAQKIYRQPGWRAGDSEPLTLDGSHARRGKEVESNCRQTGWRLGDEHDFTLDGSVVPAAQPPVSDSGWRNGDTRRFTLDGSQPPAQESAAPARPRSPGAPLDRKGDMGGFSFDGSEVVRPAA